MKIILRGTLTMLLLGCMALPMARGAEGVDVLATLAQQVASDTTADGAAAVVKLREAGPDGLKALVDYRKGLEQEPQTQQPPTAAEMEQKHAQILRLDAAIDTVSGQRDGRTSRLYWYTDLEQAKAAARASGKPILSLHMLGKLTDEFSCANSRFFRTTLYANQLVSDTLRERFVLHWHSVRPVPRITIDFGDGRKLERTITGNSIHYILNADGQPIDALPGLYGPTAFLRGLEQAEELNRSLAAADHGPASSLHPAPGEAIAKSRANILAIYHGSRVQAIEQAWQSDLAKLGVNVTDATAAGLEAATGDKAWEQLAALHAEDAKLDQSSKLLMRHKHMAAHAMQLAISKAKVEDPMLRVVVAFEKSLAEDTVRNEYQLHRRLHEWFAAQAPQDVAMFNDRVYAELFLTPSSDPWLGLNSPNVYTALGRETAAK